jgi:hypothetical protein
MNDMKKFTQEKNIDAMHFYQNNGSAGTVGLNGSSSTTQFSASMVRSS